MKRDQLRALVGVVLTLAIVLPLGWMWWDSRLPSSYSATSLGEMDYGGGPAGSMAASVRQPTRELDLLDYGRRTGSPWWFDSLEVKDGESFDVAFVADNPGIWMDHCHNLKHAREGLVTHLMYEGVTTPYRLGDETGNVPE